MVRAFPLLLLVSCVPAAVQPYDSAADCVPADRDCDGYTTAEGDCDDLDERENPGGTDACGNELDEDCRNGAQECSLVGVMSLDDADGSWGDQQSTGYVVMGGGDLDDDGRSDLLVGARGGGVVELLHLVDGELEVSATLESEDGTGDRIFLPGDVSGDGVDDLVLAREGGEVIDDEAVLWLVDGPISGERFVPAGDVRIFGAVSSGLGRALAGLDIDGDGTRELVIGAPGALPGQAGAVFLLDVPVEGEVELPGPDARSLLGSVGAGLGTRINNAGDVDGDGRDDLMLGGGGGVDGSKVWLLNELRQGQGVEDAWSWNLFTGALAPGLDGGDLDGDGYDDMVVGEPSGNDEDGRVRILSGGTNMPIVTGWVAGPLRAGARVGASVEVVQDVDGDGTVDLLIAGPTADDGAGQVWLMTTEPSGAWSLADGDIASWRGEEGAGLGGALSPAGDLDGDGYGDVLLSSAEDEEFWFFLGP